MRACAECVGVMLAQLNDTTISGLPVRDWRQAATTCGPNLAPNSFAPHHSMESVRLLAGAPCAES